MSEELTYILSLLSEQEGDAIKAIIAERDALKAENERLIELVTTQSDNLKISASNVQEMNTTIFNQFKEIQKLRAALAHFAERSNWRTSGLTYDWTCGTLPYKTPWNIAREALGETK
jgi:hypothetical protein